jgi:hypothetical protein
MLETHVIQIKGFKNVVQDGQTTGFQLRVRSPYYRGIWLSLIEGATVSVDGEEFPRERVRWTFGSGSYTNDELASHPDERWHFEEAATLTVEKPGGLKPGLHEVEVSITWRWSYIPIEFQPTTNISSRKLVLVG